MQCVQMWSLLQEGLRKMTVMAAIIVIIVIVIIITTATNIDSMLTMCQEVL